jgi:hypothetical protein
MRKLVFLAALTLSLAAGAVGTVAVMTAYPEQAIDTHSAAVAQLERPAR